MKKLLVLVLVCAMVFCFAACGSKEEPAPAPVATEAPVVTEAPAAPVEKADSVEAKLDPSEIYFGSADQGDLWYKDGVKGGDYLVFVKADNSVSGYACNKAENGTVVKTWLCAASSGLHFLDQEADQGKSEIDLVFADAFKAYDNVSGTWYVRGDPEQIAQLFAGKQLVDKDDASKTILFSADGSGKEVFEGKEDALSWSLNGAASLRYIDSEHEHILSIVTDENGAFVSLDEQNFRSFVPAA